MAESHLKMPFLSFFDFQTKCSHVLLLKIIDHKTTKNIKSGLN